MQVLWFGENGFERLGLDGKGKYLIDKFGATERRGSDLGA